MQDTCNIHVVSLLREVLYHVQNIYYINVGLYRVEVKPLQRLSISEYARRIGRSESAVRKYISTGRVKTSTETVNNRKITVVLVDDDAKFDNFGVAPVQDVQEQNITSYNTVSDYPIQEVNNNSSNELLKQIYEDNMRLVDKLEVYIERAGQVKLLEDSEHRTKESYFEVVQENKMLIQETASLKAKLELKDQVLTEYQREVNEKAELKAKLDILQDQNKKLEEQLNNSNNGLSSWFRKL